MMIKKCVLVALAVLALSSCSNNTMDSHMVSVGKMGNMSIVDLRSSAGSNSLLVAQATLHNSGNKAVTGYYRCQFYNANQMIVGTTQIWQPITIYPNEDQVVQCQATQVEATNFKVEFSADGSNVSVYNYK